MSGKDKRPLVPQLRFPEFRGGREWNEKKLDELVTTVSPPSKLHSASYLKNGKFPIIDQSQEQVCGWTDDEGAVIKEPLPLIVFGDHTCALKFVVKPFAQGADGIKILKTKPFIDPEYLFQSLNNRPLVTKDYKRHFSALKERVIYFPDFGSGEQQKIAEFLSSVDKLIALETQKLNAVKLNRKGLLQQLFPSQGSKVPRLRFAPFHRSDAWKKRTISDLLERVTNPVEVNPNATYREIGIRSHGKGIFHKSPVQGAELGDKRVFWVEEEALVTNIVFAWEQAIAVTSAAEKGMIASHRFPMYKAINGKSDVSFIKYFFLTERGKELLGIASPGGAGRNKTLGQKDFENLVFLSPDDVDEQRLIAQTLSSLDALITAQDIKISSVKAYKAGMMQQLFPANNVVPA